MEQQISPQAGGQATKNAGPAAAKQPDWAKKKREAAWMAKLSIMEPKWLGHQLTEMRQGRLSPERIAALVKAGLVIDMKPKSNDTKEEVNLIAADGKLNTPALQYALLILPYWNGASIESVNANPKAAPRWISEFMREVCFHSKIYKDKTAFLRRVRYDETYAGAGIKFLEEMAGVDIEKLAESMANENLSTVLVDKLKQGKFWDEKTSSVSVPLGADPVVRLFVSWMALMMETRDPKKIYSVLQHDTMRSIEAIKLRLQFKAGWWICGTGFVRDAVDDSNGVAPVEINHAPVKQSTTMQSGDDRKLKHLSYRLTKYKNYAADLAEMLENHLNPDEEATPNPKLKALFDDISGSYWRLRKKDKGEQGVFREYGLSIEQLSAYIKTPLDVLKKQIRCNEIPQPMSVFNGEKKYNLMQVAAIVKGHGCALAIEDTTKIWYAWLLAEAKKTMSVAEQRLNAYRASLIPIVVEPKKIEAPEPAQEAVKPVRQPPLRRNNLHYRDREYLTEAEMDLLIAAAGKLGRHGHRDATLLLVAYRHGLNVTELVSLRWEQVDLDKNYLIHVNRLRNDNAEAHPLSGTELRALRRVQSDYPASDYVFNSERKAPLTDDAIRKIIGRAGEEAGLPLTVHPHMLKHSCGYKLAVDGFNAKEIQNYLGLMNIKHTARYFDALPKRTQAAWND